MAEKFEKHESTRSKTRSLKPYFFIILLIFTAFPAMALGGDNTTFFVAPIIDVSMYGRNAPSTGIGLSLGWDGKVAIGLGCLYTFSHEDDSVYALEMTALIRMYILNMENNKTSGLFLQFNGGPVLIKKESSVSIPTEYGAFSAGLTVGWRFPFGKYFYVEPAIRGGYPYKAGAGVSAGIRL